DLQVIGIDKVLRGHTKTSRSHLFNSTATPISVGISFEPFRIFATFTGVTFPSNAIHGNGQIFMSLFADGAEGHGASGKSLDHFFGRLDFLQRNRIALFELEETPQRAEIVVLFVD